jgi:hypothetical protein
MYSTKGKVGNSFEFSLKDINLVITQIEITFDSTSYAKTAVVYAGAGATAVTPATEEAVYTYLIGEGSFKLVNDNTTTPDATTQVRFQQIVITYQAK